MSLSITESAEEHEEYRQIMRSLNIGDGTRSRCRNDALRFETGDVRKKKTC